MAEKRVGTGAKRIRVTAEFRISFREITPELYLETNPRLDPEEARRDFEAMRRVGRQARLMRALLEDEEALRGFLASAAIAELVAGNGELLRRALRAESDAEVLRPVTESLGWGDSLFFDEARETEVFPDQIDLLLYGTPVKCLGIEMEISEDEESPPEDKPGESDKYLM